MAENLGQWPSKRGPIATIRPSDGYGRGTVPLALERWYDFHSLGSHLGNVGLTGSDQQSSAFKASLPLLNVRLSYELTGDLWFKESPLAGDLPQAAEWDGSYDRGPF